MPIPSGVNHPSRRLPAAMALLALLSACGGAPPPPPPPQVHVQTVAGRSLPNIIELPARIQAIRTAEVRARVDGIVEARLYREGTDVREGAALFRIDPRPLRASLHAAQAGLSRTRSAAANARRDVERFRPLVARNAISELEFDAAEARLSQAEADVAAAQAQLDRARLDLGYATVTAPISGRAGRAQVTEGALVSAAQGTLLATVEQLDPVYVNFSQASAELQQMRRDMAAGRIRAARPGEARVTLVLESGETYPLAGRLNFLDLSVDPSTGSVSQRAEFPNPGRILLPGEFVRARIEAGINPRGIAIPQRAVMLSAQGASVMVVGAENIVAARPVKLGDMVGSEWVVLDGLKPGDRILLDGLQKVRPGMPVSPITEKAPR